MNEPSANSQSAPESSGRKVILFLDDSPEYLEILQRVMGVWSRDEWEVLVAGDTAEALKTLDQRTVDAVVIDLHMPVVDGAQFLQILQNSHPGVRKVILTGCAEDAMRNQCLSQGAELFLEKPRTTTGLEIVYQTLRQLLAMQPQEGFRGLLRRVSLSDIVQLECLNRSSSVLEIADGRRRGRIFIHRGEIIHAEMDALTGVDAFRALMQLKAGDFNLKPYLAPPRQTIAGSWESLLLEVAQSVDELCASSFTATGSTSGGCHSATWLRRKQLEDLTAARLSRTAQRQASSPTPPARGASRRGKPQVTELLAYENDGGILQSSGCSQEAARRKFLDELSVAAHAVCTGLELAEPLNLEAIGDSVRWVVRWEGTRTTFAAAHYASHPVAP